MAEQHNLNLAVENFGPVRRGEFELKPLTIFIGPNNSGKSYLAHLVYVFSQVLTGRIPAGQIAASEWPGPLPDRFFIVHPAGSLDLFGNHRKALASGFLGMTRPRKRLLLRDLPQNMQQVLRHGLMKALSGTSGALQESLKDYYGCDHFRELLLSGEPSKSFSVKLKSWDDHAPLLSLRIDTASDKASLKVTLPDIGNLPVPFGQIRETIGRSQELGLLQSREDFYLIRPFWQELLVRSGFQRAYYLPASRTGLLQGWQVFASMAVQIVRGRFGLERFEVPPFSGVAGDFLQTLWERVLIDGPQEEMLPTQAAVEILEGQILEGKIALQKAGTNRPHLVYRSGTLELPLQRLSSMVSELAPLDLWIRKVLKPGHLLIFDEPEAHLHPLNQRNVARVLVRLAHAGVRVLCLTHSSLILHQVSNHLLASEADPKTRQRLGFTEDDLLKAEDVGVYLFERREDGTHIKPVLIDPGFGISEDEFVRVAEEIGEETYRLSLSRRKRSRQRSG
jgi:predicted ATPase